MSKKKKYLKDGRQQRSLGLKDFHCILIQMNLIYYIFFMAAFISPKLLEYSCY